MAEELTLHGYLSGHAEGAIAALKAEWDAEVDRLYALESDEGLTQTRALGVINGFIGPDDVIVCAAGSLPGDLHRVWRTTEPKTYHMEYGFSCMGYEVSGGIRCRSWPSRSGTCTRSSATAATSCFIRSW